MPCFTLTGETECQCYFKVSINLTFDAVKVLSDLNMKPKRMKVLGKVLATERLTGIPVPLVSSVNPHTAHCISLNLGICGGVGKEVLL